MRIHLALQHRRATLRDERGASSVEYALIATGIAVVILVAVFVFGGAVTDLFQDSCDSLSSEMSGSACS